MTVPVACCEAVRRIETAGRFEGYACPVHGTQWIPELARFEPLTMRLLGRLLAALRGEEEE